MPSSDWKQLNLLYPSRPTAEQLDMLANGMIRETEGQRTDYTLALDGPMFERYAVHMTKGGVKYAPRNWMLAGAEKDPAKRQEVVDRYRRSLVRHLVQYLRGDTDEDHAAAVWFNVNGIEYMRATEQKEIK